LTKYQFRVSKTERYYISKLCFEIARQFSIDSVIWCAISKQNLLKQ
jgi:hypothetical protein